LKGPPASKGHFHLRGMKRNDMLNILELKGKGDRSGLFEGDAHTRRLGVSPKGWDDVGCLGGLCGTRKRCRKRGIFPF
jgi:hypothetical protein